MFVTYFHGRSEGGTFMCISDPEECMMISLTKTFGENVKVCVYPMYVLGSLLVHILKLYHLACLSALS